MGKISKYVGGFFERLKCAQLIAQTSLNLTMYFGLCSGHMVALKSNFHFEIENALRCHYVFTNSHCQYIQTQQSLRFNMSRSLTSLKPTLAFQARLRNRFLKITPYPRRPAVSHMTQKMQQVERIPNIYSMSWHLVALFSKFQFFILNTILFENIQEYSKKTGRF